MQPPWVRLLSGNGECPYRLGASRGRRRFRGPGTIARRAGGDAPVGGRTPPAFLFQVTRGDMWARWPGGRRVGESLYRFCVREQERRGMGGRGVASRTGRTAGRRRKT